MVWLSLEDASHSENGCDAKRDGLAEFRQKALFCRIRYPQHRIFRRIGKRVAAQIGEID